MQANSILFVFYVATELQSKHFALTSGKYCQSAGTAWSRWEKEQVECIV